MKAETKYLLAALAPATACVLIALIWSAWLIPFVPDPMAIHFDPEGAADGFLSPLVNLLLTSGLIVAMLLGFVVLSRLGMWHGSSARFSAASLGFVTALLSILQIQLFTAQADLRDASSATLGSGALPLAFALAVLVALMTGIFTKPVPQPDEENTTVQKMTVPERGSAVWAKTEKLHPGIQVLLLGVLAASVGTALALNEWTMYLIVALAAVLVGSCWSWRLRVDAQGFNYRSPLGVPRGFISHEEIEKAEPVEISAGSWGGWGWRKNGSGTGLITRSGEGIRITRVDGKTLEASCNDAPTAVALLKHFQT